MLVAEIIIIHGHSFVFTLVSFRSLLHCNFSLVKESLPHNSNTNSSHKIDHDSMCNHTVTVSKYQINFVLSFPPSGYYDSFSITTTCVRLLFWLPPACLHVILSEGCRNYLSFQIVYNVTAACKSLSRLYAV